jgi:hypothetical protein
VSFYTAIDVLLGALVVFVIITIIALWGALDK